VIRFARPEAFLLALPALALLRGKIARRGFVGVLRALLLVAILAALAEPWLPGAATGRDTIFVVDRSLSVGPAHDAAIRETLEAGAAAARAGDRAGVVVFGREAAVDAEPREGFRPAPFAKDVDREGSDIAAALDAALALIPPGRQGAIVVLSDGEATGRTPADVAREAARRGVRIDAYPLRRTGARDVSVEEIALPGDVGEREPFQWSAWIRSDRALDAPVALIRDGVVVSRETRALRPGLNRLVFRDRLATPGLHRYEVEIEAPGDRVVENNRALGVVRAEGAARFLCVTPGGREDRLTRTLRAAGLDVTVAAPESAPLASESLDDFRAAILENVPAAKLPRGAARALRRYVEDFGGGLLMTGGKASFGAGGYRRSEAEAALPVTLEVRQEQRKLALAMSVVLDRSGSMAAPAGPGLAKMDLANQGACAAVALLSPADAVGVIAVDSAPHVVAPMTSVDDVDGICARVRRIESQGGGIFVGAGLHAAADQLATAPQRNRHILLFADAADAEEPGDYRTFVPDLVKRGVTVSVIGLGTEADPDAELLKEIAVLGGGRCFFAADPGDLPRVFAEETMQVARSAFSEEPTPGAVRGELAALGDVSGGTFPVLGGYSIAYLRAGSSVGVVATDAQAAPLFSFRQAGLGRSAAFLGEVDGAFSGGLATWEKYGDFFTTVARWLGGSDASGDFFAEFTRDGQDAVLSIEVEPDKAALLARVSAKIAAPGGAAEDVVLARVGERRLEARVPMKGSGVWRAGVDAGDGRAIRTAPLALPYSPEFATPADPTAGERLLGETAAATGGRVEPPARELFDGPREGLGFVDLSIPCLIAALFLLLMEIAVRRFDVPFPRVRVPAFVLRRLPKRRSTPARIDEPRPIPTKSAAEAPPSRSDAAPAAPSSPTGLADALARAKERGKRGR
jgi:uncharacterized membrane protein